MRARVAVILWGLASCGSRDEAGPSRARCEQLRDRIVELRLADVPPNDVAMHRQALVGALGERFVEDCQQLTAAEATCAFAAKDSASIAACSKSK